MAIARYQEVDAIRALALIGICIVNVPFMAQPVEATFLAPTLRMEQWAACIVESVFQLKFFLLFSFLFGYGVGHQQRAALGNNREFKPMHLRRLAALAVVGCLHAIFVFTGDILMLYALLGVLLWQIQHYSASSLVKFSLVMMPVSMVCLSLIAIIISEMPAQALTSASAQSHLAAGFLQASWGRLQEWPETFIFLLLLQAPLALGACALGLAAERTQFFQPGNRHFAWLNQQVPKLLLIALPTNALYGLTLSGLLPASAEWVQFISFIGIGIGAPCLAAVYLCWFSRFARYIPLPSILLLAGRNSLSVYISQGILAGFTFGSYGLGLFDQLNLLELFGVSLCIAAITILAVGSYAKRYQRGPLEPIFRRLAGS